ncbi:hypothetical protein ABL78_1206 [Leptomonas seymouri]|uniref:Uncharacterized protein n=1 Tax=Leptomonas seymouri TaxID=5684 RepID=A0A0N1IMF6_LEPSE|nr:hypothetical protein ABL78_1206 [Leptomonas seymouri]|eukprot:KPI89713.1 hypothetical protein ABL78_1206 [Leptomonas seymouri]
MPVDYSARLEALRQLYERVLQKDESIPESAYKEAGVKNKARIKDIEKEISAVKKMVSMEVKKVVDEDIEKETAQLAKESGITVEEFKATVLGTDRPSKANFAAASALQKKERADQRQLKEMRRQLDLGEFDMQVDYV